MAKESTWFWPKITDEASAKKTAKQGMVAAIYVAASTSIVALLKSKGFDDWSLIDAAIFAIIAYGIYKVSRTAAVVGFTLFLLSSRIFLWVRHGLGGDIVAIMFSFIAILVTLAFINSMRGTFAYHKF